MTKRTVRLLASTAIAVVLGLVSAWAYSMGHAAGQESDGYVEFLVREGEDYRVPYGQVAVITYLGDDSITMTDVGVSVDGNKVLTANADSDPDGTRVLVPVCAGSTIKVYGGLVGGQDALCRGILVARDRMRLTCP